MNFGREHLVANCWNSGGIGLLETKCFKAWLVLVAVDVTTSFGISNVSKSVIRIKKFSQMIHLLLRSL